MGCLKLTYSREKEPTFLKVWKNEKIASEKVGLYDFHARQYDPALGRWNSIDPLADFMPGISPYNYCYNNPISYVDPDGLSPEKKRKRKLRRAGRKRSRQQAQARRKRDKNSPKGKKYNPNFHHLGKTNRGLYIRPEKYNFDVSDDIDEGSFDFEQVNLPDMQLIDIKKSYFERLEEDLTGTPRNFTNSFGSRPGHHDGYISNGKSGFDSYVKQIAELINQKPNIKIKVVVSTGYGENESLTHDGSPINIYTAPGVKIAGTSNRLLKSRRDYIKGALKGAGVPSSNISTSYKFGQSNSVIIKVTK